MWKFSLANLIKFFFLNAIFLQDLENHVPPHISFLFFFIICKLPCLLVKNSRVILRCLLHNLEFSIFLLLDWLLPKSSNPRLSWYLTHSWGVKKDGLIPFPRTLVQKLTQQTRLEFEFSLPISVSALIMMVVYAHPLNLWPLNPW